MTYNTKQKETLLKLFMSNRDKQFSIEEIKKVVGDKLAQATLYRHLDYLLREEGIHKYVIDNKCYYQYDRDNCDCHYHLVCNCCKKIIHLDCEEVSKLTSHVEKEHEYKIDSAKVVFYGTCKECMRD